MIKKGINTIRLLRYIYIYMITSVWVVCMAWNISLPNFDAIGICCNNKAVKYTSVAMNFFLDILYFLNISSSEAEDGTFFYI